jgi:hypothetical protein
VSKVTELRSAGPRGASLADGLLVMALVATSIYCGSSKSFEVMEF